MLGNNKTRAGNKDAMGHNTLTRTLLPSARGEGILDQFRDQTCL